MALVKFVIIDNKLIPWHEASAARSMAAASTQSHLPAPMVIRDKLDGVVNPCDGKPYDSKRAYYKAVKDAGCVIVGNEAEKLLPVSPPERRPVTSEEIATAMQKVEAGYKPRLGVPQDA